MPPTSGARYTRISLIRDAVPWVVDPNVPDVGLKVLRVSEETGITSLDGPATTGSPARIIISAHRTFMVLNGSIGYRAGPPEGYGPGVWFYEPAGARHESTQRVGDESLIYSSQPLRPDPI